MLLIGHAGVQHVHRKFQPGEVWIEFEQHQLIPMTIITVTRVDLQQEVVQGYVQEVPHHSKASFVAVSFSRFRSTRDTEQVSAVQGVRSVNILSRIRSLLGPRSPLCQAGLDACFRITLFCINCNTSRFELSSFKRRNDTYTLVWIFVVTSIVCYVQQCLSQMGADTHEAAACILCSRQNMLEQQQRRSNSSLETFRSMPRSCGCVNLRKSI